MAVLLIILKVLLIILLVILGIVLLVMIMPVGAEISFIDGKFRFKVKAAFLNVMDSEGKGMLGLLKKLKKKFGGSGKHEKIKEKKPEKSKIKKKKKSVVDDEQYLSDFDFDDANDTDEPSVYVSDMSAYEQEVPPSEIKTETYEKPAAYTDIDLDDDPFEDEDIEEVEDEGKRSLGEWVELGMGVWESAQRPLLKIFKGFRFKDLYIDFIIADEDAYDCALKYGKYSGMVYNIIGFLSTVFTVRLKTVDVNCGFGLSKGRWDASCKLDFRAGTAVIAGIWFLITYLFNFFIPDKIRKFKRKKSAARQK